jgi:hypothetical protein
MIGSARRADFIIVFIGRHEGKKVIDGFLNDRTGFLESVIRFRDDEVRVESGAGRAIVYVQMSKSGNPSFTRYLSDHFRDLTPDMPWMPRPTGEAPELNRASRLIRGQFRFEEWQRWRKDAWLVTFLREPVRRVIAQYFAHRHPTPSQRLSAAMTPEARRILRFAQHATLEQYILSDDPVVASQLRDLQTRALSCHASSDHPDFVASAIENLEKEFLFFGVAELYEASIRLFRAQTGSTRPYCSTAHRRLRCPEEDLRLSDRAIERLKELVAHDAVIYQRAVEIFHKRCHAVFTESRQVAAYSNLPAA